MRVQYDFSFFFVSLSVSNMSKKRSKKESKADVPETKVVEEGSKKQKSGKTHVVELLQSDS